MKKLLRSGRRGKGSNVGAVVSDQPAAPRDGNGPPHGSDVRSYLCLSERADGAWQVLRLDLEGNLNLPHWTVCVDSLASAEEALDELRNWVIGLGLPVATSWKFPDLIGQEPGEVASVPSVSAVQREP